MAADSNTTAQSNSLTDYHKPRTVEDVTERNVQTIAQLEEAAKANRSKADQIADVIARFCGTMTFVWVHIAWYSIWILGIPSSVFTLSIRFRLLSLPSWFRWRPISFLRSS